MKSEDGTGSRHPLFGDAGSVTPPGNRSLQRCSGLLFLHHAGTARRDCLSENRTNGKENTHRKKKSPQTRAVAVWGLCHAAILLRSTESRG